MVPSAAEHCKQLDAIHGMSQDVIDSHIEFAKLHREAILEAVIEKAEIESEMAGKPYLETCHHWIDKQSILNSYPIELIK